MTNTVSYNDEELARFYGVRIDHVKPDWIIKEYRASCRFTGKTIRRGTIEFVTDRLNHLHIKMENYHGK